MSAPRNLQRVIEADFEDRAFLEAQIVVGEESSDCTYARAGTLSLIHI